MSIGNIVRAERSTGPLIYTPRSPKEQQAWLKGGDHIFNNYGDKAQLVRKWVDGQLLVHPAYPEESFEVWWKRQCNHPQVVIPIEGRLLDLPVAEVVSQYLPNTPTSFNDDGVSAALFSTTSMFIEVGGITTYNPPMATLKPFNNLRVTYTCSRDTIPAYVMALLETFRDQNSAVFNSNTDGKWKIMVLYDLTNVMSYLDRGIWYSEIGTYISTDALRGTSENTRIPGGTIQYSIEYGDMNNQVGPVWVNLAGDSQQILSSRDYQDGLVLHTMVNGKTTRQTWTLEQIASGQCPIAHEMKAQLENQRIIRATEDKTARAIQEHEAALRKLDLEKARLEHEMQVLQQQVQIKQQELANQQRATEVKAKELEVKEAVVQVDKAIAETTKADLPNQQDVKASELAIKKLALEVKERELEVEARAAEIKARTSAREDKTSWVKMIGGIIAGAVSLVSAVFGIFSFFRR